MRGDRYISTRGGSTESFAGALRRGLAPDGGLYMPQDIPSVDSWRGARTFQDVARPVLKAWLAADFGESAVERVAEDALNFNVPVVPLTGEWEGIHILELFHGPTLSFKDFGARTMARLMALASSDPVTILVATSGDTGSAVADGFSGVPGVRVVLLFPKGQVSPIQEQQLIVEREGVVSLRVEGTFDDCQRLVKGAFSDPALASITLSSANSINIGRLIPQSLYYLWAGVQVGEPLSICVPSGNLGNLTGAMLAQRMGLQVSGFLAAHNANAAFPRYLAGYEANFVDSVRTISNAMDVGAPSNFERLRWLLGDDKLRADIQGETVTDGETLRCMRAVFDQTGYLPDPHTAVGLEAVRRVRKRGTMPDPIVVAATAHPAKFPQAVADAIGAAPDAPSRLEAVWKSPTRVRDIPATAEALRDVVLHA